MQEESEKIPLSEVANSEVPKTKKGIIKPKKETKPALPKFKSTLSNNSSEILDEIYAGLGGVEGSRLYWLNHEEQFRTMVESKFLTKQVLKEAAAAQAQEVGKNIFMTFIQNNGLVAKEDKPQVQAEIITPEIEEEK